MLDKMQFNKIYDSLKEMTGVIYSGSIPQREVLDRLKHSYALLYPNTYPETYCNVIMEARACRTPFITSDLGALKETGGNAGLYVKGSAYSEEYQEKFLNKLFSLVDNEPLYAAIKDECYPIRTWDDYSEDLERLLAQTHELLEEENLSAALVRIEEAIQVSQNKEPINEEDTVTKEDVINDSNEGQTESSIGDRPRTGDCPHRR